MDVLKNWFLDLWNLVDGASIRDALDIIVVSFLIYMLFSLFRHSSAMKVVRGIVFFLVVLGVSELIQLDTLSFVLRSTLAVGLIAIVVLFQPELRRVLEQMGGTSFFSFFSSKENYNVSEYAIIQTVEAAKALSWAHEGALVVFQRNTSLSDIVKTGTVIDSSVSSELLKNIFYPKAPLHDGAVIISNGRIAGAGCMLPLTTNTNLSKELGMRHRAGIGISENSDAIVVIVSEESGSISIATDGVIKRHLTADTLEKILRSSLIITEETKPAGFVDSIRRKFKGSKKSK